MRIGLTVSYFNYCFYYASVCPIIPKTIGIRALSSTAAALNAKKHREIHRQAGKQAQAARFDHTRFIANRQTILLQLSTIYYSMTQVNATSEGFAPFITNYFESVIIRILIEVLAYLLIAHHFGWPPFKKNR